MQIYRRLTLLLFCAAMALGAVAAQRRLAQHENDSISSALATIWGDYIRNKAAKDGPEITAEYMRGIDSALRMAQADDAFYQGLEEGVTMVNRIRQVEKMGEFKVDLGLFGFRLQQIAKGKNVGFTEKSANRYLNWFVGMTEAKRKLVEGSKPFLEAKAKEEGIEKRPSGLLFEVITEGEGDSPGPHDKVLMRYTGSLIDGTVFNNPSEPMPFEVDGTIEGMKEGLQLMKLGGRYRLYIPAEIGYGEKGAGDFVPGGAATIFDVELVDLVHCDENGVPLPADKQPSGVLDKRQMPR